MNTPLITVPVSYRLREYLSSCIDFAPYAVAARQQHDALHSTAKHAPAPASLPQRMAIVAFATPAFFYKVARVGSCTFQFTSSGLARQSKLGTLEVAWCEIKRVYRLSQVYLFAKEKGAMPLPYRCLSVSARAELESLLSANGL